METLLTAEVVVTLLIAIATLVAIVARRARLPYTVSLVLVGLVIAVWRPVDIQVTPELILSTFVPPLIFEAAFQLDFRTLRTNLGSIVTLAVPGVLITALLVGGLVAAGTGLPFGVTVVFGALIAATDPVAVVSLFRALGAPKRLASAVEGESLFNDGTAIVVFRLALAAAVAGTFHPIGGLLNFGKVALGGLAIGLALGWLVARLMARIDDRLIETTLTTLLAYGAYLLAEYFHVSGVLAVVAAGLFSGNVGLAGASPTTKIMLYNLWHFLAFLANSLVFLLIGLAVDIPDLWANRGAIAVAVAAVLIGRAVAVYSLSWRPPGKGKIPFKWQHVLFWGGLRGAISLALALSLPATLPHREALQAMTFGVLLFTLLVQGTTIQFLLKRLGLVESSEHRLATEAQMGRLFASQAGLRRLEQLHRDGLLTDEMWAGLRADYNQATRQVVGKIRQLFHDHAELEREMLLQARREALLAERGALSDALRRGLISEATYDDLGTEIDNRLEALALIQSSAQDGWAAEREG